MEKHRSIRLFVEGTQAPLHILEEIAARDRWLGPHNVFRFLSALMIDCGESWIGKVVRLKASLRCTNCGGRLDRRDQAYKLRYVGLDGYFI